MPSFDAFWDVLDEYGYLRCTNLIFLWATAVRLIRVRLGVILLQFGIASEEKNKKVLAEAGDKIQRIASVINERRNNRIDRTKFFWPLGKIMSSLFMSQINGKQVKFEENGKCISCGTCVKICPNQNINLSEGKPVWGRNCELCMACLHWCPVKAIEYGRNSRNGRRYHHPAITVYDMVPKDRRDDT